MARLEAAIDAARQDLEGLVGSQEREAARWRRMARRGQAVRRATDQFAVGLAGYREALDGRDSYTPRQGRRLVRPAPSAAPVYLQPSAGRDLGPDL